jgi:hypothetical protein
MGLEVPLDVDIETAAATIRRRDPLVETFINA